jgi:hypothetical protein
LCRHGPRGHPSNQTCIAAAHGPGPAFMQENKQTLSS